MRFATAVCLAVVMAATSFTLASQQTASPNQAAPQGVRLEDIAWPQAETILRPDTVVVIPIGAAAKEHGPHLKLRNDLTMAEYLTERVAAASDVVIAPTLTYHFYPAFVEYPGSTTLTQETAQAMTVDVVRSLARYGPRRFYALNTGISTLRALEPAARALAADGILFRYTDLATLSEPAVSRVQQQEGGTHADEIETSMMLYIDPSSVDMSKAVKDYHPSTGRGGLRRQRGEPGTYSPTGIWGDPTLATREKGQTVTETLVKGILADIESVRRQAPPPAQAGAQAAAPARPPSVPAPPVRSGCTPGDDRSIRQLGDAFTLHWTNADAVSLGALWTEGGDIMHPDGVIERTRDVIATNRADMFRRREYRGSRHPVTLTMIRCVDAEVAVADGRWELRGVTDAAGKALSTFEGQVSLVVKRSGGGWQIDAYRYTIKPAPVAPPTFLKRPGWPGNPGD